MIERFKLQFLEINSSRTGQITDSEWNLFLEALEIDVYLFDSFITHLLTNLLKTFCISFLG